MNTDEAQLNALTERIIGAAIRVSNALGTGYLEKVFENAMVVELREDGLLVQQQVSIPVHYKGQIIGDYVADLIVEDTVIIELKAVRSLDPIHVAQCLNYLKTTGKPIALLLNFGTPRLQIKRLRL